LNTDKVKAYLADFSVTSAFMTIGPLKRLTLSQYKHDTLTVERLVKSAVILGDVCPVQTTAMVK